MELVFLLGSSTQRKITSLLFFLCCCFVWRSEADCAVPERGEHSVLTDQALLMDEFPEGVDVTLECGNGYEKEAGSEVISCRNGKWTPIELICKKMDCGAPNPQPNMRFNTSAGTLFGDTVTVTCDVGYEISGSSYKQCFSWGWMGKASCHRRKCKKPAEVTNGNNSWDSTDLPTYGKVIFYTCDEGYTLIGHEFILCDKTGEYSAPPPECKDISTSLGPSTTAAHRDIIIRGGTEVTTCRDGGHTLPGGVEVTQSDVTSSPQPFYKGTHDVATDAKDIDYLPVILSVVCVTLVVCIGAICLHRCLLRRKGSYDTREGVKPEFLLFQNI
ncbi:complement decay-accelerating factor, GPI-anchored [Vanacampus margaritifer]